MQRVEHGWRCEVAALGDQADDGRVADAWMLGEKVADSGGALGDPRPFVEQPGDGKERGQVDLDRLPAERRSCARPSA